MLKNKKIGIAISLYNKFEELAILHDIFRSNFKNKYYLYVCSNHPNALENIKKMNLDFDGFIQGEDIYFSPSLSSEQKRLLLVCRSSDTVKKSCQLAIDENCDYVMHIHCDAWPLDENKLLDMFYRLENSDYSIFVRGLGWSYFGNDRPVGGIDDHFFFFKTKDIKSNNIFNYDVLQMWPHMLSIHGILGMQILVKVGLDKCLYYTDLSNTLCWKGEKKKLPFLPVKPSSFDPDRCFLHVHRESFPDDLGKKLQSYYLKTFNLLNGKHIKEFLLKYPFDQSLPNYLTNRLNRGIKKLKLYGYDVDIFAQEIKRIENELDNVTLMKVFKNYLKKVLKLLALIIKKQNRIWPTKIENYYKELVKKEYFPERKKFWFEKE